MTARSARRWFIVLMCWCAVVWGGMVQGQSVAEAVAAIDECVQKLDKAQLPGPVADVLKLDRVFVEKALLELNCRVSDLVFIRALAQKSAKSCEAVLSGNPEREWIELLKKQGVKEEEIMQLLDDAYADLALKMLEFPKKKENVKKTAKR